jgi:hypothetical protein
MAQSCCRCDDRWPRGENSQRPWPPMSLASAGLLARAKTVHWRCSRLRSDPHRPNHCRAQRLRGEVHSRPPEPAAVRDLLGCSVRPAMSPRQRPTQTAQSVCGGFTDDRSCAGFWTPAAGGSPRARPAGVQKAPGREVAVSRAAAGRRALWGFQVRRIRWRRDAGATRPGCPDTAAGERGEEASREGLSGINGCRSHGLP